MSNTQRKLTCKPVSSQTVSDARKQMIRLAVPDLFAITMTSEVAQSAADLGKVGEAECTGRDR
jgi:hypothetical protein